MEQTDGAGTQRGKANSSDNREETSLSGGSLETGTSNNINESGLIRNILGHRC